MNILRIELRCNAVTQFASQINQIESDITQTINNLKIEGKKSIMLMEGIIMQREMLLIIWL